MPLPGSRRFLAWLIGAPIILGRYPSLSAHERESVTNLFRLQREKERERQANDTWEKHNVLITANLLSQRLSSY
jgi:hypothetical protein